MRCWILIAALAITLMGCGPKARREAAAGPSATPIGERLTLTIVPYEAAQKMEEEYSPMARFLARKLGRKEGRYTHVVDYAGVLAALQTGAVDVAYLSPFPYAIATSRMKLHPLAMPVIKQSITYRGILFTRADSPIRTLQDLKGKVLAFGDPTSTTGYLLPRGLLEKNGIALDSLGRYYNAGDANVVVKAVENGMADAGAAYENVFEVTYRDEPEKAKRMRVIARTEPIPNGIYVGRGNLPPDEVSRLRKAFLEMNTDPEGKAAIARIPQDRIVPPDDRMFDSIRETARILNLDLTALEKRRP